LFPKPLNNSGHRASGRARAKGAAPTVIVFAREPIAGSVKTRLIPRLGAAAAARLADAFIVDALGKAAALNGGKLVIAGASPGPVHDSKYFTTLARRFDAELVDQGRGDLGRRMACALAPYVPAPGAVLIGTDIPSLPRQFIRQSMSDLRDVPVVVAPALDGGYYLVGACGRVPDIFRSIAWGGGKVMAQTLRRLHRLNIPYRIGHWWYDVDRPVDLEFLASDLTRGRRAPVCPATVRLMRELGLL
jgi:uncharacterized protein